MPATSLALEAAPGLREALLGHSWAVASISLRTAFYFLILCPVLVPSQGFPEIHKNKCRLQSRRPEICSQNFPEGVPLDKSLSSGYPGFSLT